LIPRVAAAIVLGPRGGVAEKGLPVVWVAQGGYWLAGGAEGRGSALLQ
jgi:hypothetical protein